MKAVARLDKKKNILLPVNRLPVNTSKKEFVFKLANKEPCPHFDV